SSDTSWMRLRPPSRKCAPAPARSTLGDHGSAVPGPMPTPQPKAAAERMVVPTFPGALTPLSTRRFRSAGGSTESGGTTSARGRQPQHDPMLDDADIRPLVAARVFGESEGPFDLGAGGDRLFEDMGTFDQGETGLESLPGAVEPTRCHHRRVAGRAYRLHRTTVSRA